MSAFYDLNKTPRNILNQAIVRAIISENNGAWFDPEDMSTMFQDAAGTTPVTALEQPVGRWLDKSGNGNHATQSITSSRPTLSARYNLLTKTEDFANVAWAKPTATVEPNSTVAPDGTLTGDKIIYFSVGARVTQDLVIGNSSCVVSVYLKPSNIDNGTRITLYNVTTSTVISSVISQLITTGGTAVDNGWYRYSLSASTGFSVNNTVRVYIYTDNQSGAIAGSSLYVWGAQLNIGPNRLPYQRVNTPTDYDSVGWPKYLRGDGVDDFYNLPFMNLYGNGSCSIVAARDAISQATDTYIISERSTTDADPKYFPSRQLASGGNMDSYIVSDEGTVRLDTTGSAFSGAKLATIRSVVDTGSNIKLFKDGAVVADDNYTREGTLTLNNTTIGASVSTTTSNYANMRLYGIIVTKSALSDTDRKRCERFLASRLSTLGVTLS